VAPPTVAVNLSGAQMKLRRDFSGDVAAALRKWGLAPWDLEFEVSEAVLAASSSWHPDPLQQLRDLGVGLTIDDFGSDYTSIGRVKAYGVKRFKIAPQFINTMASDPTSAAVVRTMISLANQLGIELIAKNIETEAQEHFLLSITESPEAQGYFYSKPLTSSAMTALLRRHSPGVAISQTVLHHPATPSAT
jgi:EAL domain-containing protein (putative c-di-GMP-specific phosphodiesterase class I)